MPIPCSVPHCPSKSSGHVFPREPGRLQQWLRAMRMESYVPRNYERVCRKHFTADDYMRPVDSVLPNPRPILKRGAVPSIFPWTTGKIKKVTSYGQTHGGMAVDLQQQKTHQNNNYHYKNKPKGSSNLNQKEIKIIPISFKLPESRKHNIITAKSVKILNKNYYLNTKEKQVTRIPLTMKTSQHSDSPISSLRNIDDIDFVICEKALEVLSCKIKTPLVNQSPTSRNKPYTLPNLHSDVTITRTKHVSKQPILSCFVQPEDNAIEIKQEQDEISQSMDEIERDGNLNQIADPLQYNSGQCSSSNTKHVSKQPILSCFVQPEDNAIEIKQEDEEEEEIEIDSNLNQITDPLQYNSCQCSNSNTYLNMYPNMEFNSSTKKFCIEHLMDITNPAEVEFFTGFKDYEQLKFLFNLLGDDVNQLNLHKNPKKPHNLRPCDEFLLTLLKLRRNKLFTELGFKFRTDKEEVGIIFRTWINFLFLKFKEISRWMSKAVINKYLKYGKGKPSLVIIESTGLQLKVKEHDCDTVINTDRGVKVFVEMTRAGDSVYVSESLPGSISDGELIVRCTLDAKHKSTERMSTTETDKSNISKMKKIEKVIGLSKLYTILNGKMDNMLVPIANQIVFVCFMLTNFVKRPKRDE